MSDLTQQPEPLPLSGSCPEQLLEQHDTQQQYLSALDSICCASGSLPAVSRPSLPVQLRRGRWDEEDVRGACSSGSEGDEVPAVKPGNMSKREWELLQEARELEQGAFAFDKSVALLL